MKYNIGIFEFTEKDIVRVEKEGLSWVKFDYRFVYSFLEDNYLEKVVSAYLTKGKPEQIELILLEIIKELFNNKEENDLVDNRGIINKINYNDLVYLYSIARIYNINGKLNIGYNYKDTLIINVLSLVNDKLFNEKVFLVDSKRKIVDYSRYLEKITIHTNGKITVKLLKKMASLGDVQAIKQIIFNGLEKEIVKLDINNPEISQYYLSLIPIMVCDDNINFSKRNFWIKNFDPNCNKFLDETQRLELLNIGNDYNIFSNMSEISRNFYILGNEMLSFLEMSPFADFSICSLQFYKIIEREIKSQILKNNITGLNQENIFNDLSRNIKLKKYTNSWLDGLTLDKIYYLLTNLIEGKKKNEGMFFSKDTKQFFNNIFESTSTSFIEYVIDIIHPNIIKIFRNPPAHTKPLDFEKALDAKKILVQFLKGLGKFTKIAFVNGKAEVYYKNKNINDIIIIPSNIDEYILCYMEWDRDTIDKYLDSDKRYII